MSNGDDDMLFIGTLFSNFYTAVDRSIMAIPYTGLFIAASCNSRSSHGQYTRSSTEHTRSSTEHFQYRTVTSARLLGQNY